MFAAVAVLAVMGSSALPVDAHWSEEIRHREVWREPGHCVQAAVMQNHVGHYSSTSAHPCDRRTFATWHLQYTEFYKTRVWGQPGTYCFAEGWKQSGQQHVYHNLYGYDPGHRCNYSGANVWVSIDSRQFSWDGRAPNPAYKGGFWPAATKHCHCP